jgi:hypothetical protein
MIENSVRKLGFWSALLAGIFSIGFTLTGILSLVGVLVLPWDPVLPDGFSFLLALSFVIMMVSIHYRSVEDKKIWSHIGIVFAVLYAAMVSIVYLVVIIYVTPKLLTGHAEEVAPFRFLTDGSFMQVLDGAGYFFMSLSTLFAAPVFSGTRLENLTRRAFITNGVLSVPILLSYSPLVIPAFIYPVFLGLAALWIFTTPLSTFLAALCFRRSN